MNHCVLCMMCCGTGRQKCIGCLKLQVSFRKRATNHRALWRKITSKDKASYSSSPLCTARSRKDVTRNCHQNTNRNSVWSKSRLFFEWAVWKGPVMTILDSGGMTHSCDTWPIHVTHDPFIWRSVLQRVAVCCSVLQCVAVCCSVSQCVTWPIHVTHDPFMWHDPFIWHSVLQCVAVCCSVLQCVAVWHTTHSCDTTHSYVWHDSFASHQETCDDHSEFWSPFWWRCRVSKWTISSLIG